MSRPSPRRTALAIVIALGLCLGCGPCQKTLPIYNLAQPTVTPSSVERLASSLFDRTGEVTDQGDRYVFRSGAYRLDVYKASGGIWAEDTTALWNPDSTPALPATSSLAAIAEQYFAHGMPRFGWRSRDTSEVRFDYTSPGATHTATLSRATHDRTSKQLDVQLNFAARVQDVHWGQHQSFGMTGGGGRFKVVLGNGGRVIGFHGVWREIRNVARRSPMISIDDANQKAHQLASVGDSLLAPTIVYHSAPAPFQQSLLYPVYHYRRSILDENGRRVVVQPLEIPATTFVANSHASTSPSPPTSQRTDSDVPRAGSMTPEGPEESGTGPAASASNPYREVAAAWEGLDGGLQNSEANVTGFLEAMRADGWATNFHWSGVDAWVQDWKDDRARWADAADLLYYSGHGSINGWTLEEHGSETEADPIVHVTLKYADLPAMASAGGAYGARDLEWLVISACDVFEDEIVSPGGGDALQRWSPAFGGLHMMMGYGSTIEDSAEEGKLFAKYVCEGMTVAHAWLRATSETQDSTNGESPPNGPNVWAAVMWAHKTNVTSPWNDHLWDHGNTAPDPVAPDEWDITWTQP